MKFAEPVLFPIVKDELELLRFATDNYIEKYDVMCNYNYQRLNFSLLESYVDPDLQQNFIECLQNDEDWYESVYSDYFKYFVSLYLRKKEDDETLIEFLKDKKDFTFKKLHHYPNQIYEINKYYNTIIILNIPSFSPVYNKINRKYKMPPNYVNYNEIINKSVEHLVEGGYVYVCGDFDKFGFMAPESISYKEEINNYRIFEKEKTEKKEKNYRYNGL